MPKGAYFFALLWGWPLAGGGCLVYNGKKGGEELALGFLVMAIISGLICRSMSERNRRSERVFRIIAIACMVAGATVFLFTQRLW